MKDLYLHSQASLFSLLDQIRTDLNLTAPTMQLFKFDAAGEEAKLPENDLIGPFRFTVTNEGGLLTITAQIVVSTLNDTNLFRLDEIVNEVFNRFTPDARYPLLNAKTGAPLGVLIVSDETTVLPIERSNSRPVKSVAVELRTDRSLTPA